MPRSQSKGRDGKPEDLKLLQKEDLKSLRKMVKGAEARSPGEMLDTLKIGNFFGIVRAYPDDENAAKLVIQLQKKAVEHPDVRLTILTSGGYIDGLYGRQQTFIRRVRNQFVKNRLPIPEEHQLRDAFSEALMIFIGEIWKRTPIHNLNGYIFRVMERQAIRASLTPEVIWQGRETKETAALERKGTDYCSAALIKQSFSSLYSMLVDLAPKLGRSERLIRLGELFLRCVKDGRLPSNEEQAEHLGTDRKLARSYETRLFKRLAKFKVPVVRSCQSLAAQGIGDAQFIVAALHCFGWGVAQSYAEGIAWLGVAAGRGHANAQYQLGLIYFEGWGGVEPNYPEGMAWLSRAAEQGHSDAKLELEDEEGLGE